MFRLIALVPPSHRRLDRRARRHARADVQRGVVVGEPHLHAIARRRALDRFLLDEVGQRRHVLPGGIVQPSIDANGAIGHAHGVGALPSVLARLREAGRRVQEQNEKNRNQETQGKGQTGYRGENQKLVLMAKK